MKLILVPEITPRVEYTAAVIFNLFSHTEYHLTLDKDEFIDYQGDKLNYTPEFIENIPWIRPQGLLFENNIIQVKVPVAEFMGVPVIFPSEDSRTLLPFDIFAAVFYFLSRYEEYLPFQADEHGRFTSAVSLAGKNNFQDIPVVDHWINMLTGCAGRRTFKYISTIDIDVAWAYRHKGWIRNAGGFISCLFKGRFHEIVNRAAVLTGIQRDPYDTYRFIQDTHEQYGIKPVFFVLLGDYACNDKNVYHSNPSLIKLIRNLEMNGEVGIHPSYASFLQPKKIETEISRLADITGKTVEKSRQHFLRLSLPDSFVMLLQRGIKEDFTMGFPDKPGFRTGSCTPCPFYDLSKEQMTRLILYPFTLMEGTLKDYMGCSPKEAVSIAENLINQVRKVNGTLITIWHNESLGDKKRWKGWRKVFIEIFELALKP